MTGSPRRSVASEGIGRRALLGAAAWSVPAVALAMSVPAASASGECGSLVLTTQTVELPDEGISTLTLTIALVGGDQNGQVEFTLGGSFFAYSFGVPVKTTTLTLNNGVAVIELVMSDVPGETAPFDVSVVGQLCTEAATIDITDPNAGLG